MKRWITKLTVLVVGVLMTSTFAFAGEIGKVTAIEGKVDILQPGQSVARPAEEGAVISVGDIIRTKSASKAEITFTDNTVVNLAEKTRVEIKDYRLDPQKKRIGAVLNIERGKIRATVSKSAAKDSFIVNTPNASGSVKGTDLYVIYQKSSTGVVVLDGKLSVANSSLPDKSIEITSGNTTVISSDQPPTAIRAILTMEKKSHEADTQIAKARKEKPFSAEGYSSPEDMTAIVVKVSGSARIRSRGALTWYDAKIKDALNAGDVIETKDDGKIEIKLENGNVINLKPNSELKLQKLSKDLKTGDYENLLESSRGKLRAQVQKLNGNSKFEVKTPTAVACVRGTVLFLNILPNMTTAYFENGNGTVQNLVSGTIQIVAAGNSSSADDQGNVSPPAPPSDEQQSEWQEGWESEGGGEGYSAPGGDTGGEDTGGEDAAGTDLGGGTDNPPFDDVPFTDKADLGGDNDDDTGDTIAAEDTLPPTLQANFTGLFGNYGSFQEDEASSFSATLTSYTNAVTITPWPGTPDPEDFTITGTYSNPNGRHLWFGEVPGIQVGDNALLGWVGGSWGSWEGALSFIYIDSSGTAGHLFGHMSGPTDNSTGTFSGDGDLYIIPRNATDVSPQNLSDSIVNGSGGGELYVSFNDGYLDTEFYRETKKIEGENWGIWREIHRGTYDRPDELPLNRDGLPHWLGVAGGNYNNGGYFFSAFEGIDNSADLLRIDVVGTYLDYEKLGAYYGTILGAYEENEFESYDFEGVGLGGFEEEVLTSSGRLYNSIYSDDWGYLSGLIGTVGELWNDEPFDLVSIGEFENYGTEPFIWFSGGDTLYSSDPFNETYTTYDYGDGIGAFYGITGGIGDDNMLEGMAKALYIDPDGNAGILSGNLNGAYSNYVGYLLQGELTKTQMALAEDVGVIAEDLADSVWGGGGRGQLAGSFTNSGGEITGWDSLTTMSIVDYEGGVAQNWGIYGQTFNGEFSSRNSDTAWSGMMGGNDSFGAYYYRWGENPGEGYFNSDSGYWIANITNGVWDDINAKLHGNFLTYTKMGTMDGEILGTYEDNDGDGDWQAVGLGTWEGKPLTFSGYWGNDSLYDNEEGYIAWAGEDWGLFGSATPQWWNESSFPVVTIGEYYYDYGSEPYIWNTQINSYNVNEGNSTTLDGGAFWGYTGGIWKDEIMDGAVAAIYIAPDGSGGYNAGVLRGDVSGNYYPGIEMWKAEGTLTPTQMATDIGIGPEDLSEAWESDYIYNNGLFGNFFNGDGEPVGEIYGYQSSDYGGYKYHLADPDDLGYDTWGIFDIKLGNGNYFYNPDAENNTIWSAVMGGTEEDNYGTSYWLTDISGTWQNNEIRADLVGNFLSHNDLGTIEGDLFGVNNGGGTWIATTIGSWSEVPLAWSAEIDAAYHYYDYWGDYIYYYNYHYGLIGATESPFPTVGTKTVDINLMGETYPEGYITWWGYLYGSYADESKIPDGFIAGRTNSIEGMLVNLYVDSSGNAGTLEGTFDGDYYPELDMWQADGTMTATQRESGYDTAEWWTNLNYIDGYFNGNFNVVDGGEIYNDYGISDISYGYFGSYTTWLVKDGTPEPWGIYNIELGGYYDPETSDNWTLNLGGDNWRGMDDKYWLATITGSQWSEQRIAGELTGQYLTSTALGTILGNVLGSYDTDNEGIWEAIALGTFTEEPLTFSGYWKGNSLYYNYDGEPDWAGSEYGLIGSTTPNWWNEYSFPVVAMGKYYYGEIISEEQPKIWNTPIQSYESIGGFFGYTGGIWNNEDMDGAVAAIYVDPSGNAGLLKGDVSGNYYPELAMWMADGALTPTQMATGLEIDPEDTFNYIRSGYINAYVDGGFASDVNEGLIKGWDHWGDTYFIYNDTNHISQPWGIYDLKLEGPNTYFNPANSTIWFADIDGSGKFGYNRGDWIGISGGTWLNGEIRGALAGLYVTNENMAGLIRGDVFGLYDETGDTWIGESIGVFNEMGAIDRSSEPIYIESEFFGTGLGSFESGGTLEVVSIEGTGFGISNIISEQDWGIWTAYLDGTYTEPNSPFTLAMGGTHTGFEGTDGYWLGTLNGDWENGLLDGDYRGVWFELNEGGESFAAGPMTGEVYGTYDEIDMTWQATGVGDWVELAELDFGTNADNLLFNDALAAMVEVPITETYTALLTDVMGNANITAGSIDLSVYNNEIFTGIVAMNFLNLPGINDTVSFSSGSDNLGLTFTSINTVAMTWAVDALGQINNLQAEGAGAGSITVNGESYDLNGLVAGTLTPVTP